jgi:DNA-binding MarR family transcriptional regulator
MDINPNGVASLDTLRRIRTNLQELDLITQEIEEGPRPKTFLVITPKGRRVAEKVREILEILEE